MSVNWPADWQHEAIEAITPYLGADARLEVWFGSLKSIQGSLVAGFVYLDEGTPMMIHDWSGRPDVYPWKLLGGPILRIYELRPRRRKLIVFEDPRWTPYGGEKGVRS